MIEQLANFEQLSELGDREKSALRFAEVMTRDAHRISDEQFSELRGFFQEGEIVELAAVIGLFNYFNRFNDALRMEPTRPGER